MEVEQVLKDEGGLQANPLSCIHVQHLTQGPKRFHDLWKRINREIVSVRCIYQAYLLAEWTEILRLESLPQWRWSGEQEEWTARLPCLRG